MKRILTVALAVAVYFALAFSAHASIHGAWTASPTSDSGKLQFHFTRTDNNMSMPMAISSFTGLSEAQIAATTETQTHFEMQRDAGTIVLEGYFKDREGAGHFTFTPKREYLNTLRSMGVDTDMQHRRYADEESSDPDETLFALALHDVSTQFIREMKSAGYNVSLDGYLSMRIFRISKQLVDDLRALGFQNLPYDTLIASQIHRVTPLYIRDMRAAGYGNLSMSQLIDTRIHRATPEFVAEMATLGYRNLPFDDLIAFRIHRVTGDFIRELRDLGYTGLSADKLVAMRIHRVTPDYIRELKAAGYSGIPADKLVEMRIHGIDSNFVKRVTK
jgi:hypothetical protein